jgi:hypothetical protein
MDIIKDFDAIRIGGRFLSERFIKLHPCYDERKRVCLDKEMAEIITPTEAFERFEERRKYNVKKAEAVDLLHQGRR